jgi:hypothetical protein
LKFIALLPALFLLLLLLLPVAADTRASESGQLTIRPRVRLVLANCEIQPRDTLDRIFARVKVGRYRDQIQLDGAAGFFPVIKNLNPWLSRRGVLPTGRSVSIFYPEGRPPQHCRVINQTVYGGGKPYRVRYDLVYVRRNQSLDDLLRAEGVGAQGTPFRIAGSDGFALRTRVLNPQVRDWRRIPVGTPLVLTFPERAPFLGGAPALLTAEQKAVIARPEAAPIEDLVRLPKDELEKVDWQVIKEKLTADKIASLDDKEIAKIPESVKEEKAWEFSFFDSLNKGVNRLVNSIGNPGPSAYIGLRAAQSLVYSDPLLRDTRFVGVFFEGRGSWTDGLRLYYDRFTEAEAVTEEGAQNVRMNRMLGAKAFALKPGRFVDTIHITPRLGTYTLSARLPAGNDLFGNPILNDFEVTNAVAAGMELDAEWSSFFYILRLWVARDVPLGSAGNQASVTSRRFGTDIFLKGGGFTLAARPMSLSWLIFVADERLSLKSKKDATEVYTITMPIPYAGLGASLAW